MLSLFPEIDFFSKVWITWNSLLVNTKSLIMAPEVGGATESPVIKEVKGTYLNFSRF